MIAMSVFAVTLLSTVTSFTGFEHFLKLVFFPKDADSEMCRTRSRCVLHVLHNMKTRVAVMVIPYGQHHNDVVYTTHHYTTTTNTQSVCK